MTYEELKKIDPPYFIKGHSTGGPTSIYLSFNKLSFDKNGSVYVNPEFEMEPRPVWPPSKYNKAAAENNPFYYYGGLSRPWPRSRDWHLIAVPTNVDKIKVFNDDKHFQKAIMLIFRGR